MNVRTPVSDVLIYIEDPGAANFLARLASPLKESGISSQVIANGLAIKYCQDRNIGHCSGSPLSFLSNNCAFCLVGTSENNDSPGFQLIEDAKARGIVTVGVIDMQVNADKRFCGKSNDPLKYAPDWLFVPDEMTRDAFIKINYKPERILITGNPHLEYLQDLGKKYAHADLQALRARIFPNFKENQFVIGFVAEPKSIVNPSVSYRSESYEFKGRQDSDFRTLIILEEMLDALKEGMPDAFNKEASDALKREMPDALKREMPDASLKPYVVVRLHPKNTLDEFAIIESEVDHFSAGGDPLEVVMACDLVVGMTSMLLQEALVLGKPVISVLPRIEEFEWLTPITKNKDRVVYSQDQLQQVLKRCLIGSTKKDSTAKKDPAAKKYSTVLQEFCLTTQERKTHLSGRASEKMVGFIKQCLKQ